MDGRRAEPAGQCDQGEDDRTQAAAAALDMHAGSLIVCIVRPFSFFFCHKRGQYHYLHMYLSISVHTGNISVYIFKQVSISNLRNSGPQFDPRKGAILEQNYKGHFCPSG